MRKDPFKAALAGFVIVHFALAVAHGVAHGRAQVPLTPAALAFVVVVIQLGPLAGLALIPARPRAGAAVAAISLAGALLFGVINHFVLPGPDHVSHIDVASRALFGWTAALLALVEAGGTIAGAAVIRRQA